MRFFIDKNARRAYLFADTHIEEISLRTIFSHVTGPLPNIVKFYERAEEQGFQSIAAHIEFIDAGAKKKGKNHDSGLLYANFLDFSQCL